jgi:hypothetical protein
MRGVWQHVKLDEIHHRNTDRWREGLSGSIGDRKGGLKILRSRDCMHQERPCVCGRKGE